MTNKIKTSSMSRASYENAQLNHVFLFDNIGSKAENLIVIWGERHNSMIVG